MVKTIDYPLLTVKQWRKEWDVANWNDDAEEAESRPKPPNEFYIATLPLGLLRKLSGVRTRTIEDRKNSELESGYQRNHDESRLKRISRYIEYGFPLSQETSLNPLEHTELINPGWLPTAILVNVIDKKSTRTLKGKDISVRHEYIVHIKKESNNAVLSCPNLVDTEDLDIGLPPFEIIDGQHRLLAADSINVDENYQVPVVIFNNLPLVWQAYLFWVINVEPKRINPSLAFDIYPELRDQSWLNRGESIKIYQEHRSQELVEALWRHPASPWKDRIQLFGNRVDGNVSNAAAIRSLMATFVRTWPKTKETFFGNELTRLGGLFGSVDRDGKKYIIKWRRPAQAAFLILIWDKIREAVKTSSVPWVESLKKLSKPGEKESAFEGKHALLATDQGFRAVSFCFNALCQLVYTEINLLEIESSERESEPTDENITHALKTLKEVEKLNNFLSSIAEAIITNVDWRTSSTPELLDDEKVQQAQYRGSSGYTALNQALIKAAAKSNSSQVKESANKALILLGWTSDAVDSK